MDLKKINHYIIMRAVSCTDSKIESVMIYQDILKGMSRQKSGINVRRCPLMKHIFKTPMDTLRALSR